MRKHLPENLMQQLDTETRNAKRQAMQEEAVRLLLEEERLIVNWGTGVGKSRVAIRCIEELEKRDPDLTVLLLVTETAHKKNWRNEFDAALGKERAARMFEHITMECYASFKNYNYTKWTLVVADEAHHLRSDMRTEHLETLYSDYFLALSATISERGDGQKLLDTLDHTFGPFITLEYDVNDAIRDGVLPDPDIYVINVNLSEAGRKEYDRRDTYFNQKKKEYENAREDENIRRASAGFAPLEWKEETEATQSAKQSMLYAGKMRKDYLGAIKRKTAERYINELRKNGKRFICFCTDIQQAQRLGGGNCINSDKKKKENSVVIDAFNAGQTDSIFTVDMIKEGQNLANIDAGIIIQLGGKERDFKQRFGRVLRSEHPVLYILFTPGTVDEGYIATALAEVEQRHIHGYTKAQSAQPPQLPPPPPPMSMPAPAFSGTASVAIMTTQRRATRPLPQMPTAYLMGPVLADSFWSNIEVTSLEPGSGAFVLRRGGIAAGTATGIKARVTGIFVNPRADRIDVLLRLGRNVYVVTTRRRASWGLLMSLASAQKLRERDVTIRCDKKGQYNEITVWQDGRALRWANYPIPKDETGRMGLINGLVYTINDNIRINA